PARGDLPNRLDVRAAHRVHPIVEVHRRVTVWREELDALGQARRARRVGDRELAVLVAGEGVLDPRPLDRLGREGLVGRERLEAGVHHYARVQLVSAALFLSSTSAAASIMAVGWAPRGGAPSECDAPIPNGGQRMAKDKKAAFGGYSINFDGCND